MGIWHPSYEGGTQEDSASLYSHCCRILSPSHHCRSCPEQQASATHLSGRSRRCSSHHSWTLLDWETHQGTPSSIPPPKDGLRKVRWSLLRAETEKLWKRWHTAYVQSLQSRQKWTRPQPNMSVGDIVLLKDDSLKLHSWPLAKVTDVSPGPDGVVRVVTLTLPGGRTFTRHVRHLVPLMRALDCSPCSGGGECPRSKGWICRLPQQEP